ncbi:hypothetical protein B9479_007899 [Cryptococcus floricola]|uniref:Uncharacterized protein n=1 Tax=Cryptococcus floricola TaxID=2591691 RepID=A0A5D3AKM7_9TREE|nr:hypothetical protein B9479_007899 [Cryptococcus floricola]
MSPQDNVNQRSEITSSAVDTTAASTSAVTSQQGFSIGRSIGGRPVIINSTHFSAANQVRSERLFGMMEDISKEANIEGNLNFKLRVGTDAETIGRQHREGDGGAQRTEEGEQAASASAQSETRTGGGVATATVRSFDPSPRPVAVEEVEDEEFQEGGPSDRKEIEVSVEKVREGEGKSADIGSGSLTAVGDGGCEGSDDDDSMEYDFVEKS